MLVSFLSELQFPAEMCLPFDSNIQIESVVPEKCKLLDSFTVRREYCILSFLSMKQPSLFLFVLIAKAHSHCRVPVDSFPSGCTSK